MLGLLVQLGLTIIGLVLQRVVLYLELGIPSLGYLVALGFIAAGLVANLLIP